MVANNFKWLLIFNHRPILIILLVGLILRLLLVFYVAPYPERYIQADAVGYNRLAINLALGNGFSMRETAPFVPDNFRTLIYPLTIAIGYILFGYYPAIILLFQVFLNTLTIFIAYHIAKLIGSPSIGFTTAILLAISPLSITYAAVLWSDTEYTFFLMLSILMTLLMFSHQEWKWVILSGLSLGVATLTHPRSLYLALFFAVLLLAVRIKQQFSIKQILIHVSLYLLIFNLVLLPWRARNYIVFGVPNLTSSPGINMLFYGAALVEATQTGEDQWSIAKRYEAQVNETSDTPLNEAEFANLAFQIGLEKIIQNPWTYAKVHLIGTVKVFLPGTLTTYTLFTGKTDTDIGKIYSVLIVNSFDQDAFLQTLFKFPIFVWGFISFDILYLFVIYLFSVYAIIQNYRSISWVWFFTAVIFYLAIVAGPAGAPRFRVPIMPLLSILSAYGMVIISQKLRTRKKVISGSMTLELRTK